MTDFKADMPVKPSPIGVTQAGLDPYFRSVVKGVTLDGKIVIKIENRERALPPIWFEPALPGEIKVKKPVTERFDQCRFQAGETVCFMGHAHGFEGWENKGKVIAVVPPKADPLEVLNGIADTFSATHTFRLDCKRIQPTVRTHRYWIEAIPNDSKTGKPALFLKTNQWVKPAVD
jgi:hypothetical protein